MRKAILLGCIALAACGERPSSKPTVSAVAPPAAVPKGDPVEGLRVATRVGCNGCHGEGGRGDVFHEDAEQGRLVAPNLTKRRDLYDDEALTALLREGRTHDGHVPWGMPIKMFQHLSDREIRDITAWLRTTPAIDNPELPEGQWSEALAKAIADGTHPWLADMQPDPGNRPPTEPPTEALALGEHIAMTTCGECHGWDLAGFEGDDTPPLTIVAKAYTPEKFARLMRTGEIASGGKSKTGLMSGVAAYRFSVMTDAEIAALKQYLDSR
jgi:mono/diheme cytochrome c family protein